MIQQQERKQRRSSSSSAAAAQSQAQPRDLQGQRQEKQTSPDVRVPAGVLRGTARRVSTGESPAQTAQPVAEGGGAPRASDMQPRMTVDIDYSCFSGDWSKGDGTAPSLPPRTCSLLSSAPSGAQSMRRTASLQPPSLGCVPPGDAAAGDSAAGTSTPVYLGANGKVYADAVKLSSSRSTREGVRMSVESVGTPPGVGSPLVGYEAYDEVAGRVLEGSGDGAVRVGDALQDVGVRLSMRLPIWARDGRPTSGSKASREALARIVRTVTVASASPTPSLKMYHAIAFKTRLHSTSSRL